VGLTSQDEVTRRAAELARKTAEVHLLQRVSAEINSTLDLDEICELALRTMDDLFEFHHAIILLLEPGSTMLKVVASRGYENQAIGGEVPIGMGVIGVVAQKRRMMHVNNLGQQRAYVAAQRREMVKSGRTDLGAVVPVPGLPNAESQVAIPLIVHDDLIGVFSIESPRPRTFGEHERDLVSIIANQIASAIHNARLYDERRRAAEALQEANASLEARVAQRTAALERELRVAEALLNETRTQVEGALLGDSSAARILRDAIADQAFSAEPLLLTGPAGAGKEAAAHAVHSASGRPGAFIFVSCPELGSQYRHAAADRTTSPKTGRLLLAGKLELAVGGTVFLDAVHELPAELQRALDEMVEESSRKALHEGVRIIASTTHDIRKTALASTSTLFRRLAANCIVVPPLVSRREDIAVLVDHFVRRYARRIGKVIDRVSDDSLRRLEEYSWPGNVRELRTVIERAVLLSRSTVLEIDEELLREGLAIGSYRLVELLGVGGMGEVWRAKHRLLARPAAVKLIRHDVQPSAGGDEQLVRRFEREAQVTAGLRSPHTVQLYDFGTNDTGSFYYVMELLEGLDLHRIVTRFGPQPADRVVWLLRQACRSLAEAHERGLVHRDIKPANLFVTRLGTEYDYLKILDFGVVKDQSTHDLTVLSSQGVVQGTPAFMAPEVVLDGTIDGRSDLYSLACAAYWILTGQTVFEATTAAQMLLHHAQTIPIPPSHRSEMRIPPALEALIVQCLEKNPANRIQSAGDLEFALERVQRDVPWTTRRAREWWDAHAPESIGSPAR
jgi:transcriptional regulator with GAF, ATPase, and Fis domain